jgi:hypothetical protein
VDPENRQTPWRRGRDTNLRYRFTFVSLKWPRKWLRFGREFTIGSAEKKFAWSFA